MCKLFVYSFIFIFCIMKRNCRGIIYKTMTRFCSSDRIQIFCRTSSRITLLLLYVKCPDKYTSAYTLLTCVTNRCTFDGVDLPLSFIDLFGVFDGATNFSASFVGAEVARKSANGSNFLPFLSSSDGADEFRCMFESHGQSPRRSSFNGRRLVEEADG